MKETPILFTPDNMRAIIEDRKNQTRRLMKPQPTRIGAFWEWRGYRWDDCMVSVGGYESPLSVCPYGQVGDRIYCKEGVIVYEDALLVSQLAGYYMDGYQATKPDEKRFLAMFMPKRMARRWLEITEVRVQRLQDISEDDAKAEGVRFGSYAPGECRVNAVGAFMDLWNSINAKRGHPWESNPYVWALSFKVIA